MEHALPHRHRVWRGTIVFSMVSAIAVLLSSCAADQQSRLLASQLRKMTAEYNAESTAKIEAEKKFYQDAQNNIDNSLNVVDPTKPAPDVRNTLAYGRIITDTNSGAQKLTGELVDGTAPASVRSKLILFVQDGIAEEDQAFQDARAEQGRSALAMQTDFGKLEQYQTSLSELTKQLANLEKAPTPSESFSGAEVFGQAVIEQLKGQAAKNQSTPVPPEKK